MASTADPRATVPADVRWIAFLAQASQLLASSLEYRVTLASLARLAVPVLGDACVVFGVGNDGLIATGLQVVEIAVDHRLKQTALEAVIRQFPPSIDRPENSAARAIVSGQPVVVRIDARWRERFARGPDHLRLLDDLGDLTIMSVPLVNRDRTLCVMLLTALDDRQYTEWDADRAVDLARLAAPALDNARLFEQARAAERWYRRLFEGVADAVLVSDSTGRYVDVNPAATDLLGYTRDEFLAMHVGDLTEAADRRHIADLFQAMRSGRTMRGEAQLRHKDGSLRYVDGNTRVIDTPAGKRYLGVVRDVGARKAAESSRRLLAAIVESTTDAVISLGDDGIITSWNAGAEQLYGYSAAEAIGQPFRILFPSDHAEPIPNLLRMLLAGDTPAPFEVVRRRRDGSPVAVLASASVIQDDVGVVRGFATIERDISDRKRAETALRQQERRLRQAEQMQAVGQVAGGVAHEFNNLFTVLLANADRVLAELPAESPLRPIAVQSHDIALRAAALTQQLLAFSHQQVSQPELIDLAEVVQSFAPLLERLLGDVRLAVTIGPVGSDLVADRAQIEQILLNLVINARDATPAGGTVMIETSTEGDQLVLRVSDTGTGMSGETRQRAFEPFFTTKPGASGIGLTTVAEAVTQLSGMIDVDTVLGQGTRVTIHLPRGLGGESQPPIAVPAGETVLVVDDFGAIRHLVEDILRQHGYHVLMAADGMEALALHTAHPEIGLVITDVMMPVMSGRDLAAALRSRDAALRILYMSGFAGFDQLDEPLLPKPFTADELVRRVASLVR